MAPEILQGKHYNSKVDIWSLGTLLFHLLTGTYPFYGNSLEQLKQNVRGGSYKIPRDTQISLECLDFLNSCLKFESTKRKGIDDLISHPFLSQKPDAVRESRILDKMKRISLTGPQLAGVMGQ